MDIQIQHMTHRLYFMQTMFWMSLYNWYNYSLFDSINNSFLTTYYQNCMLMLFYLVWDTYYMITKPILFRTDLIIHHSLSFFTYVIFTHICPLQMSNILIMECISLMNNILINNPRLLKIYRTFCILCIRIPLWNWIWIYYFPNYILPHYKPQDYYVFLSMIGNLMLFIPTYDLFILYKLYNPSKIKQ